VGILFQCHWWLAIVFLCCFVTLGVSSFSVRYYSSVIGDSDPVLNELITVHH